MAAEAAGAKLQEMEGVEVAGSDEEEEEGSKGEEDDDEDDEEGAGGKPSWPEVSGHCYPCKIRCACACMHVWIFSSCQLGSLNFPPPHGSQHTQVLLDVLLSLLSRPSAPLPSAPLRAACEALWRAACDALTPAGMQVRVYPMLALSALLCWF